ncbi:M15 family metallopeptidase [Egbenema bharatensis]|uniref:M15 family metallopeptidase n=1 Tax=Egbenema bharatensis TaxID=3463334 RepID=UPI003A85D8E2
MDNTGLPETPDELTISSENLTDFSAAPAHDIPEAIREIPGHKPRSLKSKFRLRQSMLLWGLGGLGLLTAILLPMIWPQWQPISASLAPGNSSEPVAVVEPEPSSVGTDRNAAIGEPGELEELLGHIRYEEAPTSELEPITDDGTLLLRRAAAEEFLRMMNDARADGVRLVPLSGFRSLETQESLFFDIKAQRGQQATIRAEVSAPPGYSEHHTGYAIDIGDGYYPDANLRGSFENTRAFEWLQENAAYYSFELSFPENNPQGVSYEPWHWRFVGDRHSLETFYRARTLTSNSNSDEPNNP